MPKWIVTFTFTTDEIEAENEEEAARIGERALRDVGFAVDVQQVVPEHHELHTDTSAYDEALMRQLRGK